MKMSSDTLVVTPLEGKKQQYLIPFILITSLFFLWGMAYGLLDVLNKHFQEALKITTQRSTLLQTAYFGAYFLIAYPAGIFMTRFGYKKGILLGLCLYALGAFLFFPASQMANFSFFLLAIFVLASGLVCLETAAIPYVTVLEKKETSVFRLNLAQSFNGIGAFVGPIIGARLFFDKTVAETNSHLDAVQWVYVMIGLTVVFVAFLFFRTPLPELKNDNTIVDERRNQPLSKQKHLINAVVAQFFYVAAQVGIAALFINYCTSVNGIDNIKASYLLSVSLLLFTAGRFAGTALMKIIAPNKLLALFSVANIILCSVVISGSSWLSVYALMAIFFFESIMFPTIFALGIKDLGNQTQKGSSLIIMSIVGGALVPYLMGYLADKESVAIAYSVPLVCFVVVAWYGIKGYRIKSTLS